MSLHFDKSPHFICKTNTFLSLISLADQYLISEFHMFYIGKAFACGFNLENFFTNYSKFIEAKYYQPSSTDLIEKLSEGEISCRRYLPDSLKEKLSDPLYNKSFAAFEVFGESVIKTELHSYSDDIMDNRVVLDKYHNCIVNSNISNIDVAPRKSDIGVLIDMHVNLLSSIENKTFLTIFLKKTISHSNDILFSLLFRESYFKLIQFTLSS